MPGLGWTFDDNRRAWVLLDRYGLDVGAVTVEVLARCGADMVNRAGARKEWPELTGVAWWHLELIGGPQDGLHDYLDPRDYAEPPDDLFFAAEEEHLLVAGPGAVPELAEVIRQVRYRRQIQICGHGRCCAYPYTPDRELW